MRTADEEKALHTIKKFVAPRLGDNMSTLNNLWLYSFRSYKDYEITVSRCDIFVGNRSNGMAWILDTDGNKTNTYVLVSKRPGVVYRGYIWFYNEVDMQKVIDLFTEATNLRLAKAEVDLKAYHERLKYLESLSAKEIL